MLFQDGLGPSLVHVMLACGQVSGETCTDPLGNILFLQSNRSIVTISLALSVGTCSQKSYHCVGAGLFLRLGFLPACAPGPWLELHAYNKVEVHFVNDFRSWLICIGSRSRHGSERTGFGRSHGPARSRIFRRRHIININCTYGIFTGFFMTFWLCCTSCKSCTGSVHFGFKITRMLLEP